MFVNKILLCLVVIICIFAMVSGDLSCFIGDTCFRVAPWQRASMENVSAHSVARKAKIIV
uniref:Uncharacterized protein n=1 Tax=Heterorhabditis bacteriophora TaxID=37862 RepID=A0A1I7XLZ8_HETBA